jgi:hypothetical protein
MQGGPEYFIFKTEKKIEPKRVHVVLERIRNLFAIGGIVAEEYPSDLAAINERALENATEEELAVLLNDWTNKFEQAQIEGRAKLFLEHNPMFWHVYKKAREIEWKKK